PPGTLWRLSGATQPPAGGDPSHPAPTGAGRGGNADRHPLLAVGPAAEPRFWAGYDHLSLLPPRHAPDHCRHHPGVSDHAHLAASPAGICPTAHCPGPLAPRDIYLRLSTVRSKYVAGLT